MKSDIGNVGAHFTEVPIRVNRVLFSLIQIILNIYNGRKSSYSRCRYATFCIACKRLGGLGSYAVDEFLKRKDVFELTVLSRRVKKSHCCEFTI